MNSIGNRFVMYMPIQVLLGSTCPIMSAEINLLLSNVIISATECKQK